MISWIPWPHWSTVAVLLLVTSYICTFVGCVAGPGSRWHDHRKRGPYFDRTLENNVTTTIGRTVLLHCRIFQLDGQAVSWIRKQDLNILTLDSQSYTTDDRFMVMHEPGGHDFNLRISGVQTSDDGVYECQINTEPKRFWPVTLHVQAAHAKIVGAADRYVQLNSNIQLRCELRVLADPPVTLGWQKDAVVVDLSSPRAGLSIQTERSGAGSTSYLVIARARQRDSGTYTCQPSEGEAASVRVHVIDDEHPAAMQTASSSRLRPNKHLLLLPLLLPLLLLRMPSMVPSVLPMMQPALVTSRRDVR